MVVSRVVPCTVLPRANNHPLADRAHCRTGGINFAVCPPRPSHATAAAAAAAGGAGAPVIPAAPAGPASSFAAATGSATSVRNALAAEATTATTTTTTTVASPFDQPAQRCILVDTQPLLSSHLALHQQQQQPHKYQRQFQDQQDDAQAQQHHQLQQQQQGNPPPVPPPPRLRGSRAVTGSISAAIGSGGTPSVIASLEVLALQQLVFLLRT